MAVKVPLRCARCDKRLSRKTARVIDGKVLCSTCMFATAQRVGRTHDHPATAKGQIWKCMICGETGGDL